MTDESNEQVFFKWKCRTNRLITEATTIPLENDYTSLSESILDEDCNETEEKRITPLEYVMNSIIQELLKPEDE